MKDDFFVDSNVFLYLNESNGNDKREIALTFLFKHPCISPQVIFECINVCRKKFRQSASDSFLFGAMLCKHGIILEEGREITELAISIGQKYQLQTFDSKIVATALYHGCNILYSEDMQNGFIFENKLKVVNPFLEH